MKLLNYGVPDWAIKIYGLEKVPVVVEAVGYKECVKNYGGVCSQLVAEYMGWA